MSPDAAAIALFVVAEDPYARSGIGAAFEDEIDIVVVGDAEDVGEELGARHDVDLVVLDLGPDPEAAVPEELGHEALPVLALAADLGAARGALAAGVAGVVSRHSETARIVAAVRAVHAGLLVVDAEFGGLLAAADRRTDATTAEAPVPITHLTGREAQVLELMAQGLSNPEIADALGVTRHTAKFHVKAILDKLGAQTRTEAVVLAVRNGLLHL